MALQYIAEGARRGERSLMFSLDEQVPQILRNAASLGIDLETPVENGVVRLEYEPPQEIEVDIHFHHIEELVHQFQPTRVVFDSLSTNGSTLGTKGRVFRDFFHTLIALMKEQQAAAVYNHENPEMLGMAFDDGGVRHELAGGQYHSHELGRARRCLPAGYHHREDAGESRGQGHARM
jgi:circadian clock protein KaiC